MKAIDDPSHFRLHIWPLSKSCPLSSKEVQNPPTYLYNPTLVQA